MSEEKVVITGVGILAANGMDKDTFRDALRAGKSGVRKIARLETATLHTKVAGYIDDAIIESLFPNQETMARLDRSAVMSLITSQRAFADARLDENEARSYRKGILLGTACGPAASIEESASRFYGEKSPYISPMQAGRIFFHSATMEIANRFEAHALCQTISTGCSSSLVALVLARRALRSGLVDMVLVGGVDTPIQPCLYRHYDALRLMTRAYNEDPETASRPFSASRSGFVLAEGAGFVVLERESTARQRNADIYAEILGVGQSYDPAGADDPDPGLMAACMEEAITEAQIPPMEVGYVQAHANGSPLGDLAEARAIQSVFGQHASEIPVSSVKSMTGHALGASGIISVITALLGMRNGFVPPTINLNDQDPDILLDCVANTPRDLQFNAALVNAFGLGGSNASVLLQRV